jgi:hypothetical protein
MRFGGDDVRKGRVEKRGGVTFVYDSFPMDIRDFGRLAKTGGKGAVMAIHAARLAGADMAFGKPEDVEAIEKVLEPEARQRIAKLPLPADLSTGAREWLATGHQGNSSQAAFLKATGFMPPDARDLHVRAHPHDADDLRRFLALVDTVPEVRDGLAKIATLSPEWERIIDSLDTLRDSFAKDQAAGSWARTNRLMDEILNQSSPGRNPSAAP